MIDWKFPSNNFGQETGLNDAGIEHFRGDPFGSLAREIIQNSLDAALDSTGKPVEVHFQILYISRQQIPGVAQFNTILHQCLEYCKDINKTKKFFEKALKAIDADNIPVLKISDYNTTGLTGSDTEHVSDWHKLTKSVGTSDKRPGAGGSYGIGKHAPFACSAIRTVFYSTLDYTGKTAVQGVAKLITHTNSAGETTQGTGYYGVLERNRPITDFSLIDAFFTRNKVGTDVFVMGFKSEQDWETKIIQSTIENFFISIISGKLVVKVGDKLISNSNLPEMIETFISGNKDLKADKYYNVLTSPERHYFTEKINDLGHIDLYLLPKADYPKRVAMVRESGMKIFDKGNFRTPLRFAGVLLIRGDKLDEMLRSTEPPQHNAWEPERYDEDPTYAKKLILKIYRWITDQIRNITQTTEVDAVDVDGMSQYLPDDQEVTPFESQQGEGEKTLPIDMKSHTITRTPISYALASHAEDAAAVDNEENEGSKPDKGTTNNDDDGGKPKTSISGVCTDQDKTGKTEGERDSTRKKTEPQKLTHLRSFCIDPDSGIYRMSYVAGFNGKGYLSIRIVGDDSDQDPAPIISVVDISNNEEINCSHGTIGPIKFISGRKVTLQVNLADGLRCALEVTAHAS